MKIHEYQAKKILKECGFLVPPSEVIADPAQAEWAIAQVGLPAVAKAQVHAGGRGKAGGIKTINEEQEARQVVESILGKRLKTHQTAGEGILVQKVLIEKKLAIQREFYLGITINRAKACPVIIASPAGGMDIEEIARVSPEKIFEERINPLIGLQNFQKGNLAFSLGLSPEAAVKMIKVIGDLYRVFTEKDCSLVEINPLVLTNDNQLVALDAKMAFDDNALFRHPEIKELADTSIEDVLEAEAIKAGINYVRLNGNVGCIINGAGLGMATMDAVRQAGGEPANFLDVGGSAKAEQITVAFRLLLSDPNVKVILINIFGGLVRPEFLVEGLTRAMGETRTDIPLVIRLMGANATEGIETLRNSGLEFVEARDMENGVKKAVEIARGGVK